MSAWGECLPDRRGVSAQGGVCLGRHTPVNTMADRQVSKHNLSSSTVADGKYNVCDFQLRHEEHEYQGKILNYTIGSMTRHPYKGQAMRLVTFMT